MKIFLAALLMAFIVTPSFASETVKVGQTVPPIKLYDQYGGERMLGDLTGERGATLVFVRSVDWCPYCQAQLIDLRNDKEKFEREGFPIVAISYDSIEKLKKFDDRRDPGFPLLSDQDSKLIKEFGIFDDSHKEGSFAYGVPKPTVYVINKAGVVKAILSEESYKKRPQIETIMEAITVAK